MGRLALFHHKAATRWIRAVLAGVTERVGATFHRFGGLDSTDLTAVRAGACADYDLCSIGNVEYEVVAGAATRLQGLSRLSRPA
jgi:hypothetical protein